MSENEVSTQQEWAIKLFNKSPLKQKKFQMITDFMPNEECKSCLDIGSDNGVISLLLRQRGGEWSSADLIPETVESIKNLVGSNVYQIEGSKLPFNDAQFDCVIVVDMLEHIEDDVVFTQEISRVLKPQGFAIINVPNPKEGLLRKIQFKLGQTDKAHGHLRAGYTPEKLGALLNDKFVLIKQKSYSRFFSVFIDTFLTFVLDRLKKGGRGKIGTVITENDLNKLKKSFKLYSLIYPFIALFVKLDLLIPFMHGNMLISLFQKRE